MPFRHFYRRLKSSVLCVIVYVAVVNVLCLYYLLSSPSPWMSQNGPFLLTRFGLVGGYSCRSVGWSPTPLPLTALVSFPGSGNTWIRHLVQQATGIATGSVYNDVVLRQHGFSGEGVRDGRVGLIKTHEWGHEHRQMFSRAVLLIRDPFESLLAEFNRRNGGHRGHALPHDFLKEWSSYVPLQARAWMEMNNDWLKFKGPLLILFYKDLQTDLVKEMKKVFSFLRFNVTERELACMKVNSRGNFKRMKMNILQRNPYTSSMQSTITNYIQNVTGDIANYYKSTLS